MKALWLVRRMAESQPQQQQYQSTRRSAPASKDVDFSAKCQSIIDLLDLPSVTYEHPGYINVTLPDETNAAFGTIDGPWGGNHVDKDGVTVLNDIPNGPEEDASPEEVAAYIDRSVMNLIRIGENRGRITDDTIATFERQMEIVRYIFKKTGRKVYFDDTQMVGGPTYSKTICTHALDGNTKVGDLVKIAAVHGTRPENVTSRL